jgi:hypothetical protein
MSAVFVSFRHSEPFGKYQDKRKRGILSASVMQSAARNLVFFSAFSARRI